MIQKSQTSNNREEYIGRIVEAGLLEDFIKWLASKGIDTSDPFLLDNVDEELLTEYISRMNLAEVAPNPIEEEMGTKDSTTSLEPRNVKPRTPPRRK